MGKSHAFLPVTQNFSEDQQNMASNSQLNKWGRASQCTEVAAMARNVTASSVQELRNHGFTDGEIAEIIAHVALNIFTNYFNIAVDVDVDFPRVALHQAA